MKVYPYYKNFLLRVYPDPRIFGPKTTQNWRTSPSYHIVKYPSLGFQIYCETCSRDLKVTVKILKDSSFMMTGNRKSVKQSLFNYHFLLIKNLFPSPAVQWKKSGLGQRTRRLAKMALTVSCELDMSRGWRRSLKPRSDLQDLFFSDILSKKIFALTYIQITATIALSGLNLKGDHLSHSIQ